MSNLSTSDFLYVQRGTQGYKMPASELIDFIAGESGSLNYRGSVDLNFAPYVAPNDGMVTDPDTGVAFSGDIYLVSADADPIVNGWNGIQGQAAQAGDRVIFNGSEWDLLAANAGGIGVETVTAAVPSAIVVDNSDPANPVIDVESATNTQEGVVTLAADTITVADADKVLTGKHYSELDDKIDDLAGDALLSVVAGDGIKVVDTPAPNDQNPVVSIDISGLSVLPA